MKNISIILSLGFSMLYLPSSTQEVTLTESGLYSASFTNQSLSEALMAISEKTAYEIYFLEKWTDSIKVELTLQSVSFDDLISKLIEGTRLYHYVIQNRVIITYNAPIFTDVKFLHDTSNSTADIDFYFTSELASYFKGETTNVIEIGKRINSHAEGRIALISGTVTDQNGLPSSGAQLYITDPFIGTISDEYGKYQIRLPKGSHKLLIRSLGFKNTHKNLIVHSSGTLDISLTEDISLLDEITVNAQSEIKLSETVSGVDRITVENFKSVPIVLGERDILRAAMSSPGIQNNGEGSAGLYVRGGKSDQNLMLLNGMSIYNSSHFLGFFSGFNPDAIGSIEIYKGTMPAEYGGRLSSVFNMATKQPSTTKIQGEGGIGLVTSRLSLEIPIVENSTSLMISGRKTYSQWLLNRLPNRVYSNNQVAFSDYIVSVHHKPSQNDIFNVTTYLSQDQFNLTLDSLISYQNRGFATTWTHNFNVALKSIFQLATSQYSFKVGYDRTIENSFSFDFSVVESSMKLMFDDVRLNNQNLIYGIESKLYQLEPGKLNGLADSEILTKKLDRENGWENALFISNIIDVNDLFSVTAGLRYSIYTLYGPGNFNKYKPNEPLELSNVNGVRSYERGEAVQTYHGPEFRLSARYFVSPHSSVKLGYGRTRQYIHLLTNSTSITPVDMWKMSDAYIAPTVADQVSLAFMKNFKRHGIESGVELYFKNILNSIDYKVGADLMLNEHIETELLQGNGRAFGMEFSVKRETTDLNGFINYTFSRSLQKTESRWIQETINNGSLYPSNFDRPHDLNLFINYRFSRRYSISSNMQTYTGRPYTQPIAAYQSSNGEYVYFSDRNKARIPNYFRVDLGLNIEGNHKIRKLAHSFWTISIYNLTGRRNIYSIFYKQEAGQIRAYSMSIFPKPIPAISYNFRF